MTEMKWMACELHMHSRHSDGQMTVAEITRRAAELGIEAVVLTDHNTDSGLADVQADFPIPVMRGLEWTTYYGHVLTIGCNRYVDWRDVTPDNIDQKIDQVHEAGGIAGVAHPFHAGDPVCSGCHWEFALQDWRKPDMIELWSGGYPQIICANKKAYRKWIELLDAGYRITSVSARDWHGGEDDTEPYAVTYLEMDESLDATDAAKQAIRAHRAYMTVGPEIELEAKAPDRQAGIGGTLPQGEISFRIRLSPGRRTHAWSTFDLSPKRLILQGEDERELFSQPLDSFQETIDCRLDLTGEPYVLCRIDGTERGMSCPIVLTNPIYLSKP